MDTHGPGAGRRAASCINPAAGSIPNLAKAPHSVVGGTFSAQDGHWH
jgi:hypothetical protein